MKQSKTRNELIFCLVIAAAIMAVCTRSSPLYIMNNWDDANSYFTVGKSIFKGLVPYRDLFDQKGILLYFLYGIASLISYKSFMGVFVIEVIAAAATLCALFRILKLYVSDRISMIMVPLMGTAIYSSRSFWWGGSAEEMMLPFLAWGLYLALSSFHEHSSKLIPGRIFLIGGILAGCVLHIKFNSLGFYIGWILVLCFAQLVRGAKGDSGREKSGACGFGYGLKKALAGGLIFLGGMGIATIPWLLYFGANGAIGDWFEVYFYDNIFIYSEKLPMAERIKEIIKIIYYQVLYNKFWAIPAIIGILVFFCLGIYATICGGKRNTADTRNTNQNITAGEVWTAIMTAGGLTAGIYIGGVDLPYYPFSISIFVVFGAIAVGIGIDKLSGKMGDPKRAESIVVLLSVALSALIITQSSLNLSFMNVTKEEFWLFAFAEEVEASGIEDPKILNVSCLDAGLYTVTGAVPNCRFFQTQTIKLDDVAIVQNEFITEGKVDFIVGRDVPPDSVYERYELVDERQWSQSGSDFTYWLYQKAQ